MPWMSKQEGEGADGTRVALTQRLVSRRFS